MENKKNRCIIAGVDVSTLPFGCNEDSRECQLLKLALLNKIKELLDQGVDEFYTDCSFGFPLWGGEIVAGLMFYNEIHLYAVHPHENQTYKYAIEWLDRWYTLHEKSTEVITVYEEYDVDDNRILLGDEVDMDEYNRRAANFMLGDCGKLLFCGDGDGVYIYDAAKRLGLEIITISI
ncbi:MAG: SLOG family protein [Oscillospiraceae bacterium]|nr:SLOG family protein [Oscillospiraceae bacterium]